MLVLILFVSINVIDFIFNKLTESFFFFEQSQLVEITIL